MMKKCLLALVAFVLCCANFAMANLYEFSWDQRGILHQALVVVKDDGEGAVRVLIHDYDGEVAYVVDQDLMTRKASDGVLLLCTNPRIILGEGSYAADNFLLHESGIAMVLDDSGNAARIEMRIIPEIEYRATMVKYGLSSRR